MVDILDDFQPGKGGEPKENLTALKWKLLRGQLKLRAIFLVFFGAFTLILDVGLSHMLGSEILWVFFF